MNTIRIHAHGQAIELARDDLPALMDALQKAQAEGHASARVVGGTLQVASRGPGRAQTFAQQGEQLTDC
ncbi:MAG: hypothetical protein ABR558_06785 [Thioalkalivibrio sp.]